MIGVVTGLAREAACFDATPAAGRLRARCEGIGPARAGQAAHRLLADGCRALCSFGIAGGLDPGLGATTLVLADTVITTEGARHATDPAWRRAVADRLMGGLEIAAGTLIGSDSVIETPADKENLFAATGAIAVDMESHAVGAAAAAAGVPFLVFRVVSDPAGGLIPKAAMKGVGLDGRTRHLAVLGALARRPGDLPALLRLRRDSARAIALLRRAVDLAGPGLGLV